MKSKNNIYLIFVVVGCSLIILSIGMFLNNLRKDNIAKDNVEEILNTVNMSGIYPTNTSYTSDEIVDLSEIDLDYNVTGILEIPKLDLILPVLNESSEELLEVSVGIYTGNLSEIPERLIIAGHNYKSHFKNIPNLDIGDDITFVYLSGKQFQYQVTDIIEIGGSDFDALEDGEWDMSLMTCNFDGSKRVIVRCDYII